MPEHPNVLLITADHWPGSLLGAAGHPAVMTPTLDQLARNGTMFTQAYSTCPVCIPARRSLMTGLSPRTHGDRVYKATLAMPEAPTLARCFRDAGYQTFAVGKLHVFPQRDRIGFDDALISEEGRGQWGLVDDYDLFLGERGFAGQQYGHGLSNNDYSWRPWHLPEECHITNWATSQMARAIRRRDPTRPGFWYLSYVHPHPPLAPLRDYLAMYHDVEIPPPAVGAWARDPEALPFALRARAPQTACRTDEQVRGALRAFYALCTHIDHQIRVVIGALREEGLLDNTIVLFTSDHGDMLGAHGQWAKRLLYEDSARVPLILIGAAGDGRVAAGRSDDRLVCLEDIMPTLLELAGIPVPPGVEGRSMLGERRETLYAEIGEDGSATRMVHDGRFKLIYYPVGNRAQLFDLRDDPLELVDLAGSPGHAEVRGRLERALAAELYGGDEAWAAGGRLVGLPDRETPPLVNRSLSGQRGPHWPPPPASGRQGW